MDRFIDISKVNMPDNMPKINFNKRAGIYEISCSLFSLCNLNCNFCFQDHNDYTINTENIIRMSSTIVDVIRQDVIDYDIDKKFYIRIYGGELFSDNIPDHIFSTYQYFYDLIKSELNRYFPGRDIEVYWGSNGVFNNYERVDTLLENTHSFIALSYDPTDRFHNINQKEIWLKALNHFHIKGTLSSVSIMLIKPTLLKYLEGDKYFFQIPQDVSIDVNQYISNPNYEKYLMCDDEIFIFYRWCIDNRSFNVEPINTAISNYINGYGERHCYCKCSNFFDVSGYSTKNCVNKYSKLPAEYFYGEFSSQVTEENCTEVKNYLGIQKRGCMICEHYTYCPTICWTSIIFKGYKTTVCPYQKLFEYLKSNPKIIDYFKEWENQHGGTR